MMKMENLYNRLKYVGVGLAFMLSVASCSDFLEDVVPGNAQDSDVAVGDVLSVENALRGVYDGLQSSGYYNGSMLFYGDVRGEDMMAAQTGDRSDNLYRYAHDQPVNSPTNFWLTPYALIKRANNIITAFEEKRVTGGETAVGKDLLGQTLVLRALFHFDVVRTFGEPYQKKKTAPGAAIVLKVLPKDAKVQRSTVEQTYTQIETDLLAAIPLLDTVRKNGHINSWAAKSLLSRVYLYKGDYDKAYALADEVITKTQTYGYYKLVTHANYISSWSQEYTDESIFSVANSTTDNADRESIGYLFSKDGYGAIVVTPTFQSLLKSDGSDVRIGLLKTDRFNRAQRALGKFPGRGTPANVIVNNIPVIRLSELYLIAAEAAIKKATPNQTKADGYLNAIRKRANPALTDITATEYSVLTEKRKELVGEGHRFFDIIRLGLTITRPQVEVENDVKVISWNEHKIILPISDDEIKTNPDILQNDGYIK